MSSYVEFHSHGRSGKAIYREGENHHEFDWEFGTGTVVISIHMPAPAAWNNEVPWAADRRDAVLAAIVREALRSHCVGCIPHFTETRIDLVESPRTKRL